MRPSVRVPGAAGVCSMREASSPQISPSSRSSATCPGRHHGLPHCCSSISSSSARRLAEAASSACFRAASYSALMRALSRASVSFFAFSAAASRSRRLPPSLSCRLARFLPPAPPAPSRARQQHARAPFRLELLGRVRHELVEGLLALWWSAGVASGEGGARKAVQPSTHGSTNLRCQCLR